MKRVIGLVLLLLLLSPLKLIAQTKEVEKRKKDVLRKELIAKSINQQIHQMYDDHSGQLYTEFQYFLIGSLRGAHVFLGSVQDSLLADRMDRYLMGQLHPGSLELELARRKHLQDALLYGWYKM